MPKNTNIKPSILKMFRSKSRLKGVRHYEFSFKMSMQFSSGLVGCDVKGFTVIAISRCFSCFCIAVVVCFVKWLVSPETKFRIIPLKVLRNSLPKIASIQQMMTFCRTIKTWSRWQTNKKQPLMSSKLPAKKRKRRFFGAGFPGKREWKVVIFLSLLDGNLTYVPFI